MDLSPQVSRLAPEDSTRYTIDNNVLTIRQVTEDDAGMFQCLASNTIGLTYSTAQLRVLCTYTNMVKIRNIYGWLEWVNQHVENHVDMKHIYILK